MPISIKAVEMAKPQLRSSKEYTAILCSVFLHLSPLTTLVKVLQDPPSPSSQFAVSKWHDALVVADGGCINHE